MIKGTILYLGGFELPDKNAAAHRVLSNGKIFRELGYNVVFIDIDKSLQYDSNILTTYKKIQGFDCWSIAYPQSHSEWLRYLTNIDFMSIMMKKYSDICITVAYNYPALALKNLKRYCSTNKIKIIGDCTEWYSTRGTSLAFKIIKGIDSFYRMRIIHKQLNGMIVISKYLEKYYKGSSNVVRIPPLVDCNEEKWNEHRQVSVGKYRLLKLIYSGNPGRNKDKIKCLIKALYENNKNGNFILRIAGTSKEQYIQEYSEDVDVLNSLGDKIIFLGKISHNESLNYLKESDFSIFIRDDNKLTKAGFPTKFVESISCGVPVITTLTSDINEFLIEGNNGFIIRNSKSFASDLNKIVEIDNEVIKFMKDYCLKSEKFDYHHYIKNMDRFLRLD